MSVSNLTGTKWVLNSNYALTSTNYNFSFNFTSGGNSYTSLVVNGTSFTPAFARGILYNDTQAWSTGAYWTDQAYRIIEIIGGTDVTNATLIAWLEANATQVDVTDLTDTEWLFNGTGCVGAGDDNQTFVFNINYITDGRTIVAPFYSASVRYATIVSGVGSYIKTNDSFYHSYNLTDGEGWYDAITNEYNVLIGYSKMSEPPVIKITGGTDVANPDLITWLEANGTLTAPVSASPKVLKFNNKIVGKFNGNGVRSFNSESIMPGIDTGSEDTNFLTFSSPNSFTLNVYDNIKHWNGTLEYSTNGRTWSVWSGTTTLSSTSSGTTKYLYLRGINNTIITGNNDNYRWVLTGSNISCNGNIETLLDYQTVALGNHPNMSAYCFNAIFKNCTSLITPPTLPATTMVERCYSSMFWGCSSLTEAPVLSSTTLASNCYSGMFYGCASLNTAPTLPATTLADYCYMFMFSHCTSLTTAPTLPATVLKTWCYYCMFNGCTSLRTPAVMAGGTTQATAANSCCYYMYESCTSLYIYSSSGTGRTAFYKAITYSTSSSATNYASTYRMFYNCKINGSTSTANHLTAGTQYYY